MFRVKTLKNGYLSLLGGSEPELLNIYWLKFGLTTLVSSEFMQNYKLKHLEVTQLAGVPAKKQIFFLKRMKEAQFRLLGGSEPELRKFYLLQFDLATIISLKSIKKFKLKYLKAWQFAGLQAKQKFFLKILK